MITILYDTIEFGVEWMMKRSSVGEEQRKA